MTRTNLLLLLAVIACALGVITSQHQSRKLFIDLRPDAAIGGPGGDEPRPAPTTTTTIPPSTTTTTAPPATDPNTGESTTTSSTVPSVLDPLDG